jgi:hypothetical protein
MTRAQAHIAYNILVLFAGAHPQDRESFVRYVTDGGAYHEYRFQGCLGFGGKFYDSASGPSVGYYPEDATPERDAVMKRVNALLALLYE